MMKELAWNAFKKTGNINTFLELKQIESIENGFIKSTENIQNAENMQIIENTEFDEFSRKASNIGKN